MSAVYRYREMKRLIEEAQADMAKPQAFIWPHPWVDPDPWDDPTDELPPVKKLGHYPHKCPSCGGPAYQGITPASKVDCSARCPGSLS